MLKTCVFTIASKNYLPYARSLLASVQKHHLDYRRYLCLADKVDGFFNPSEEIFEVVEADRLGIDSFEDMSVRYDIMEFNTAIKPFMIEWLFNNTDADVIVYLDPDIKVFSKLSVVEDEILRGASVVLTPHITVPVEDGLTPNDYHMLQSGVFNLGFIAVSRCDEAINFVRWWGRRLKTLCASDISRNLFTDQRWCDLAPCFLNKLAILKHPGVNVAYWNIFQRSITQTGKDCWAVDGLPLVFFHFSGVDADLRNIISKHQSRLAWSDIPGVRSLFDSYLDELENNGWSVCKKWPYYFNTANDEFRIVPVIRQLFREKEPVSLPGLQSDAVASRLIEICNGLPEGIDQNPDGIITELMYFIYRRRPDLHAVFNLGSEDGRRAFISWFEVSAPREYGLPDAVCDQSQITGTKYRRSLKKISHLTLFFLLFFFRLLSKLERYVPHRFHSFGAIILRKVKNRFYRSF
jgi:hypothetical protein